MTVSTWDVLRSIGFVEDQSFYSDPPGGLSIDFGNFKLSACFGLNRWVQQIVLLSGVMVTSRTITEVECEMPQEVESWEQAVAFVTWCLDNHSEGGIFKPAFPMAWLIDGRQNRHLLPWERERAAYAARPHCRVQRDWAKVALRNLSEQIATLGDEAPVTFRFDGEVLAIRCGDSLIAMPAQGEAWPNRYALNAGRLRRLPKRLMHEVMGFSIWESALTIGNFRYDGVAAIDLTDSLGVLL